MYLSKEVKADIFKKTRRKCGEHWFYRRASGPFHPQDQPSYGAFKKQPKRFQYRAVVGAIGR